MKAGTICFYEITNINKEALWAMFLVRRVRTRPIHSSQTSREMSIEKECRRAYYFCTVYIWKKFSVYDSFYEISAFSRKLGSFALVLPSHQWKPSCFKEHERSHTKVYYLGAPHFIDMRMIISLSDWNECKIAWLGQTNHIESKKITNFFNLQFSKSCTSVHCVPRRENVFFRAVFENLYIKVLGRQSR